jgi:hypothetical protein
METGYLLFKGRVRRAGGIAAEKKCRVLPSESGMGRELKRPVHPAVVLALGRCGTMREVGSTCGLHLLGGS